MSTNLNNKKPFMNTPNLEGFIVGGKPLGWIENPFHKCFLEALQEMRPFSRMKAIGFLQDKFSKEGDKTKVNQLTFVDDCARFGVLDLLIDWCKTSSEDFHEWNLLLFNNKNTTLIELKQVLSGGKKKVPLREICAARKEEIFKLKREIKFSYKGETFSNKDLGEGNFLKGGAAREAAFNFLSGMGDKIIEPRDLDFWIGDSNPLVENFLEKGEDWRDLYSWGIESVPVEKWGEDIMSWKAVDVNVNHALVGADGLYIGRELIEGFISKQIWRVNDYNKEKRAIRAHFFGYRYGFKVIETLPLSHSYYETVREKAKDLGILEGWKDYLSNIPKEEMVKAEEEEIEVEVVTLK